MLNIDRTTYSSLCKVALFTVTFCSGMTFNTATAQSDDTVFIDEIRVTATKRDATLQEIPLAVSTINAEEIALRNLQGFEDYLASIPGVQFNYGGSVFTNTIAIRGVVDASGGGLLQTPVAIYLDETPLTLSQGSYNLNYGVFGIDQISVIKGPHSTLYGAASLGGTIKVETKKPSVDEFSFSVRGVYSDMSEGEAGYEISSSISGPLVDGVLGAELTAYHRKDAGFIDLPSTGGENINDNKTEGGRLALRWLPREDVTVDATLYFQEYESDYLDLFAPSIGDLDSRPLVFDQPDVDDFVLGSVVLNFDVGFADFVSASNYYDRSGSVSQDYSNSFFNLGIPGATVRTFIGADAQVFTQELRLVSNTDGPWDWIVGAYYQDEAYEEIPRFTHSIIGPLFDGLAKYDYETIAVFAEAGYQLSDRVSVTVGARASDYESDYEIDLFGAFALPPPLNAVQRVDDETDVSPRAAINYDYGDGSIYFQVAKGFRVGQPNIPIVAGPTDNPPIFFESDTLWNYEIGAKTSWNDRRITANAAVYLMDWQDIQQNLTASTGFTYIDNVGNARIIGAELETTALLTDETVFTFGFSYNDAELTEDVPSVAMDGQRLPGVPEWQVTSSLQHDFMMGSREAFARLDYLYYGPFDDFFSVGGAPPEENGDYQDIDIRLGMMLGKFTVQLFATNLLDERPIMSRDISPGAESHSTIRPRAVGVSVSYNH